VQQFNEQAYRHKNMNMSIIGTNYLSVSNPLMPLWWALAMPGTGHIMVGKLLIGVLLFIWEFLINTQAHLNLAILYSCIGEFQLAAESLDIRWFFFYVGIYIFNAWDAYRITTDINQFSKLAKEERYPLMPFVIHPLGINYLQRVNKWVPVFWSIITPGLGHLILRNFLTGSFLLASHLIIIYHSKALEGIYFTCRGLYGLATSIINIEWLLFLPSIYLFAACDTYYHAIEMNQLFRLEQSHYLEQKYSFYLKRNFKIKDNNP
jgi:hypothetical protein